ncbi:lysosome-associated membrane glycoprotein 2 isoform X3 [Bombina bombina]|uniref:lysosome-associated membrane glycoprotein 2 isoform X3 n=1 Tax=Bombina bombina TaxID=8345 RepID=UPI00235A5256|nr:lysosome-associated membrane glycoprotein 2 isoform X3 [Bombina bombina]
MEPSVSFIALFMLGLGLFSSQAFDIEIKDASNQTCINASLMVNFTIQYETSTNQFKNVTSEIPSKVTTTGSHCGGEGEDPLLLVGFGNNYTWSLNFTKNDTMYRGSVLTFTYNTNDTDLFPDALRKGLLMSTTTFLDPIPLNTTYKCNHIEVIPATNVVQQFWDVKLQAFVQNGVSVRDIICDADKPSPSPTPKPTTHPTESPTPAPKPVDKPITGNYSVSNATGICLLAHMGLQVNATVIVEGKSVWMPFNIDPNTTRSSGSCSNETSVLKLTDNSTTIEFLFAIKNNHFFLQEVNITLTNGSGSVSKVNNNLTSWEASLGSSYLCHKEQVVSVSEDVSINTFDVWVQPFGLQSDKFSTAEDCFADQNFTVPIVVGAALCVLVILVTVAYFIGRKKHQSAGYENF